MDGQVVLLITQITVVSLRVRLRQSKRVCVWGGGGGGRGGEYVC